jgi:hypothetical protein
LARLNRIGTASALTWIKPRLAGAAARVTPSVGVALAGWQCRERYPWPCGIRLGSRRHSAPSIIVGVGGAQPGVPPTPVGQDDARAVVAIEPDAVWALSGRQPWTHVGEPARPVHLSRSRARTISAASRAKTTIY